MLLPSQVQQAIDRAAEAMMLHPAHALHPLYRRDIYTAFGPTNEMRCRLSRGWLAVITARHVLPLWQQAQPNDDLPEHLLDIAKGVLQGIVAARTAESQAGEAWEWLEKRGQIGEALTLDSKAFYAAEAAVEALFEVSGREPFDEVIIDQSTTDSDLDPWCSDSALYAAAAYAGPVWDATSDSEKRREFWEWWLGEAVPTAWQIGNATLDSDDSS